MTYAEFATTTHFSFLRGASHPSDLVAQALALGHAGIGIADRNSVAGVVRAYAAVENARGKCREAGEIMPLFKLAVGARLAFCDGTPDVLAYPKNRAGWGRLCRLLTTGNRRAKKGKCILHLHDLLSDARDLLLILMPEGPEQAGAPLARLHEAAPGVVWLGVAMNRRGPDRRLAQLKEIACRAGVPLIATNDVLYRVPEQRPLQDVLTCIARDGGWRAPAGNWRPVPSGT